MRKNKTLTFFLVILFSLLISSNALAISLSEVSETNTITPYWTAMIQPFQSFNITDGKAIVGAETFAGSNASSVYVLASLQQFKDGTWVTIKSWSNTQNGSYVSLSQTWYVTSGYTYRLVTYHTTYFSGTSESTTLTSRNVST